MDFWRSEYEDGNSTSSALAGLQDLVEVDSPNISRDSIEYNSDDLNSTTSEQTESLKVIQTQKATLLAKKRLQAYSAVNRFRGNVEKDETSVIDKHSEKPQKSTFKKLKKTIYPDEAAKAVIRDIEILKRAGYGGPPVVPTVISTLVPADLIPTEPFIPISLCKLNLDKSPATSLYSDLDEENLFKKREIKCRNIRKSDTTRRRSPSPKRSTRSNRSESQSKKEKRDYPANWTEYKELKLDPQKDALLKIKSFKKPRTKDFSFKRYFNFEAPSPPIEIYKCQPISGDPLWIPFPSIRSTASRPPVLYSTNQNAASPGYLNRKQLFSIIPTERKALIEKLWKTPSRYQPSDKRSSSKKWYPRNWKKFENSEAKLLEKSVGLSFLQSYSDEEEEEEAFEDNIDELNVEKEIDLTERGLRTSPSGTPKEQPKESEQEIQENYEFSKHAGMNKWDGLNSNHFDILPTDENTPPVEEKEDGEVSIDESPRHISEDEYQKTKKELETLEEALKESSTNYADSAEKEATKIKDRKSKKNHKEKGKSQSQKDKVKKKRKRKTQDSDNDEESSDVEKESARKKKQKRRKKDLKNKIEKKVKRRKAKKKKPKKKKEEDDTNSESENYEVESDSEENVPKKNRKKKRKSNDKGKKDINNEESSSKVHDRKNSVDITHEGYEDDVKFFTARFDQEDDLRGKGRHRKEDSGNIQNRNKTNIDPEELTVSSKPDNNKTNKRKPKHENSTSDESLSLENIQSKIEHKGEKPDENKKQINDKSTNKDEINKSTEIKEDGKKDEIKIDLLKKNEEYLREQDRLRIKQKQVDSDETSLPKSAEPSKTEDENRRLEKCKAPDTQLKKTDESKERGKDKEIEKIRSPKKASKDLELVTQSEDRIEDIEAKRLQKGSESKTNNNARQNEDDVGKIIALEKDNTKADKNNTKALKGDFESPHHKEPLKHSSKNRNSDKNEKIHNATVVDDKELNEDCIFQRQEDKVSREQPDWEKLKTKRKRYISDTSQEKISKSKRSSLDGDATKIADKMPLDQELPIIHIKQEKDDEKSTEINTSWDTDEEVVDVERRSFSVNSDNQDNRLNLEIPLNIKHFTRREIKVETDASDKEEDLKELQRHSRDLSAERKKLAIEKGKVKELERELLHAQEKNLQQKTQMKYLKSKRDEREPSEITTDINLQTPPKKRRWDIKSSDSKASTPKIKSEQSIEIIDVDTNAFRSADTLENEYEEFLKAVTSTKKDHILSSNKSIIIDSSSDSSITLNDDQKSKQKLEIYGKNSPFRQVIRNLDDLTPKPKETIPVIDIPTVQIPLPPVKPKEIRPVPVPLPKLEAVFDLNKPLINLSLSANVTQNITLSLATSVTSISAPITSSIDISKTSVEISTPVPKDTVVSMNNIPLPVSKTFGAHTSDSPSRNLPDLKLPPMTSPSTPETLFSPRMQLPKEERNLLDASPLETDTVSPNPYSVVNRGLGSASTKKKKIFATLTLPSKKQLLNNSNLNLDDSDNDDQSIIEELKRKKLEALIEDNKKEVFPEEINKQVPLDQKTINALTAAGPVIHKLTGKEDSSRRTSPHRSSNSKRDLSPRRKRESPPKRRDASPKRKSPRRKSPRRSPRRRSPTRKRSPHRRRSPVRRSASPRKKRDLSPRKRRSPSPRRKRSLSPKSRQSPRRNRSISPKNKKRSISPRSKTSRHSTSLQRNRSPKGSERKKSPAPPPVSSPFGGPKRSVADSTISDDQLPQPISNEDYGDTLFSHFKDKEREQEYNSPKRVPLDVRISQVLGYDMPCEEPQKPTSSTIYNYNDHQQVYQYTEQYNSIQSQVTTPTMRNSSHNQGKRMPQSCYRQVGNMLQIVPNDDLIDIPIPEPSYQDNSSCLSVPIQQSCFEQRTSINMDIKPQILQVGNMLQIVPSDMIPTEMIPVPPIQAEVKLENTGEILIEKQFATSSPLEKPSAEAAMLQKIAERRAERERRRDERERRRREKEKRNKEKEKVKQAKIKIKTENMIKKALELEQEENAEADTSGENPIQWPPLSIAVPHTPSKEPGKSILLTSGSRNISLLSEEKRVKVVKFADGVRPGEGTSPSAGEELSSPPPPKKKLPKEKRYKKLKFGKKSAKKKVKVKIIKKPPSPFEESDSEDNLPPPSPPPGSPPPHIFPPRIKVNPVNNVPAAYLASIIQTAQQQQHQQQLQQQQLQQQQLQQQQLQQQQLHQQKLHQQQQQQYPSNIYCPSINLLMAPPPPPQGHQTTIPPHHQSPHGGSVPPAASPHGPQSHFHPSLAPPPPPPPPASPHNHYSSGSSGQSGHHRHF